MTHVGLPRNRRPDRRQDLAASDRYRLYMEVDHVFSEIGEFGPVQIKLFFLLGLSGTWMALHALAPNFIATDPGWTCSTPDSSRPIDSLPVQNSTMQTTLPDSAVDSNSMVVITDPEAKCSLYEKGECVPEFSKDYTSIVTTWELICERSFYPNLAQSGFFVGFLIGAWLFGTLSDMYGRKKMLFLSLFGYYISGIGYGLAINYYVFFLFRVVIGVFNSGQAITCFSLMMEVIGTSKRSSVGMAISTMFSLGFALLALLAYIFRGWRTLVIVSTLLGTGLLATWRAIPESPRWLLVQGREEAAREVLSKIAQGNSKQMLKCKLKSSALPKGGISVTDLFKGRIIRHRTVILVVAWFTNCIVYYGLSLNAGNLGGGRYLSLVLSGLVELPALYISYQLISKSGRKWSHGGLLMLGGISCLLWTVVHWTGTNESLEVVMALLGKSAVTGSFAIIYLYSAELFPTEVRSIGLGVSNVGARVGGILSPLVLLLSSLGAGVPMSLMGVLGLVAGFFTLSLPETLNQPLPETLAQLD